MSFEYKYEKYKNKYLKLKKLNNSIYNTKNLVINSGLTKIVDIPLSLSCGRNRPLYATNNILDLDCLKVGLGSSQVISKKCLDMIREEIQEFYDDFYNYLCFPQKYGPEIGFEYDRTNSYVKPIGSILEYTFPIINIPGREYMGTVDYDYLIKKLVEDKDFIDLCSVFNLVRQYILDWLNMLNTIFNLNFTNIEVLDLFKICKQLINNYKDNIDANIYNAILSNIYYLENFYPFEMTFYLSENALLIFNNILLNLMSQSKIVIYDEMFKKFKQASSVLINLNIPYIKQSYGIIEIIFSLNTLYGIDKLQTTLYDPKEKQIQLSELIENKRQHFVKLLFSLFERENTNKIVVHLALRFFTNFNTLETEGHSNSLVIYKYIDNTYLVLRTEPHRHSNIYCRPSMRKAIRDLFKDYKNVFYKDYVIKNPYRLGLQVYEEKLTELDLHHETDYDKLPDKYKIISPLQGNSGFCASWTLYTTMILLLNHDKNLDDIGTYLGSFFLQTDDYDDYDTLYTLYKHIKLYRCIIFVVCFLYRTFGQSRFNSLFISKLQRRGVTKTETDLLEKIVIDCMTQFNEFDSILKRINNISVSKPNMAKFDPHYCTDNVFNHNEMCLLDDINKEITPIQRLTNKCPDTTVTLTGVKKSSENENRLNRQTYENMLKSNKTKKLKRNIPDFKWQEVSSIAEAIKKGAV